MNGVRYETSLVVTPERILENWSVTDAQSLATTDVAGLIALKPELVLLGTGKTLRFPHMSILGALAAAGIGMEVMDTQAACRTYNILTEEGRSVAAALIVRSD